ncbi:MULTISPECIES: hypothetical protein [unclassified Mesorhizobium]|uniref:hypothetical protein n=1 Tax=unclassified Mesorhizobium TaxID=325217 RepID=UPI000F763CF6|nr:MULTISPECIES: hypothetical protein [unclassified Mesorhizobium]AZO05538.1 hypothetical protein EJ068_22540 [Mesorhizobium sp. M2A.F.Ca.ET.043.02.1.1]RUW39242.1 hypothetical protein EOA37_20665 [Mesorhizobium sp. M2A.F.Ca.ET.015.02.1.1]RUW69217.1 hypothetical protein EOA28_25875 [Mesorhizobium sp. M2A.F.Ca.ET.067.02.1.1]RVC98431.1 hypothetical protein EN739_00175 [Mesorhizobium sp. M2A.F.Ca.ET.017.03.2.1]RVD09967.1 hypothetical protein EN753_08260 [Mesorhizobium sp. M2A.F.Ca.ET.029.05.1.1]
MTSHGEASKDDNECENAERVRDLAERAGIPSGLALAQILKYGNDPRVLDREAAKLKRDADNGDR